MGFLQSLVDDAWKRSGGRCECERTTHGHGARCNKPLSWGARGREGRDAWEAHSLSGQHKPSL